MNETSVLAMNLHLGDRVRLPSGVSGEITGLVANDMPVISFVDGHPDVITRKTVMLINLDGSPRWHAINPADEVWVPASDLEGKSNDRQGRRDHDLREL